MPLLPPTRYVQWRRPGETEWQDYDPWFIPWDVERLEMRLLPRPEQPLNVPPDTTLVHLAHNPPTEYRVSYSYEYQVFSEGPTLLEIPSLREGTYELTLTIERKP